ncbi:Uncharacterised protein [Actinobacillus pleuropneumoniae]|nr:Uncharacterised protein [Actinobacillus pleuropneumoniae]
MQKYRVLFAAGRSVDPTVGNRDSCSAYRRELNLDTGIASTRFQAGAPIMFLAGICSSVRLTRSGLSVMRARGAAPSNWRSGYDPRCSIVHAQRKTGRWCCHGHAPTHIADNYRGDHPGSVLYEDGLGIRYEMRLLALTDQRSGDGR